MTCSNSHEWYCTAFVEGDLLHSSLLIVFLSHWFTLLLLNNFGHLFLASHSTDFRCNHYDYYYTAIQSIHFLQPSNKMLKKEWRINNFLRKTSVSWFVAKISILLKYYRLRYKDHWLAIARDKELRKVLNEGRVSEYFSAALCLPLELITDWVILSILASISPLRIYPTSQSSASSSPFWMKEATSLNGID